MIIYSQGGTQILNVTVDDESYRYRELMTADELNLQFALTVYQEIPVGSYCVYDGIRYTLRAPHDVTVVHTRDYEYRLRLESEASVLGSFILWNPVDKRLKFDYTARPLEHLNLIVDNLEARGFNWVVGSCIDDSERLISYNHNTLAEALSAIASAFDTEWEIAVGSTSTVISLGKVEYNKNNPLSLSYGRGNGFISGVSRTNYDNNNLIGRVYTQGGERNIDYSKYPSSSPSGLHSKTLLLPQSANVSFDGEHFSGESGYVSSKAVAMSTDSSGNFVELSSADAACNEGSVDVSDIYPSRVGSVTGLLFWDSKAKQYVAKTEITDWSYIEFDIVDNTIPQDLDYSACLMEGEDMTLIFQNGMLTAREFNVAYRHEAIGDDPTSPSYRPARRFELVRAEFDGYTMPSESFLPSVGNKYAIFGIMLPEAYFHSVSQGVYSGAEYDALRVAARVLYQNRNFKYTFKGELDGIYAKRNWSSISSRLVIGGYVRFTDASIVGDAYYDLRIAAVKEYINNPHSPTIELTNEEAYAGGGAVSRELRDLEANESHTDALHADSIAFTKRSFRDARETSRMLADAFGKAWGSSSNPVTIQTMQLLAGDESLQMRFYSNSDCTNIMSTPITVDETLQRVSCAAAYVKHFTLDVPDAHVLTTAKGLDSFHRWSIASNSFLFSSLDPNLAYYIYIRCGTSSQIGNVGTGTYVISPSPIQMNSETGYYHFMVGILNSERDGGRSYASVYGYTEILPNQITTGAIRNSDGNSYFDLEQNRFALGDKLQYNTTAAGSGNLLIKGGIVQSPSGDKFPITTYRGEWVSGTRYYYGDVVSHNGGTWIMDDSTVSYTTQEPSSTATRWSPYAQKGAQGKAMRGPSEWNSTTEYLGREDATGDFYDVVMRNSAYYFCKVGNTNVDPEDDTEHEYWSYASNFEFIASKVAFIDQSLIKDLTVAQLRTMPENGSKYINIAGDVAEWRDENGAIARISLGNNGSSGGQSSMAIATTRATSATTPVSMKSGSGSYLTVSSASQKVSIPKITVTLKVAPTSGGDGYFGLYLEERTSNTKYYLYRGVSRDGEIPATTIALPIGTYDLKIAEEFGVSHTVELAPASNSVSVTNDTVKHLFCNNAMVIKHGQEGIEVTENGAKVTHGNTLMDIVGSSDIRRIVYCTAAQAGTDPYTVYLIHP